ncbi:fimbrial assembly chaperone [Pantoea sp. OXWO6B1]|uniref:fimbrial assembly chaperone n=1 Tax=Pantoea sp. OXWO6B1 TaxID=1835724 RepID=UPI0007C775F4|nr:fimbrial assembly chaperone [Pantoea sp. OXWO6B1]OAE08081.1 fimbrial assembly protein [Pantoea sp. OXWO6B1]
MHSYKWWSAFSSSLFFLTAMLSAQATAVVNIDKTRIVFNANEMAQSINLVNSESSPAVLQIWTDDGDIHASPDKSKTPVMAIPPVLKMLPGELRSLKLMLTSRAKLRAGKETLYWLNIYQIPALKKSDNPGDQKVILPLRLRLKVFIRPTGLGAPQPEDAQKLRFTRQSQQIMISNPTPWYMSLNVKVEKEVLRDIMVEPQSYVAVPVTTPLNPGANVEYEVIDDRGNADKYYSMLHPTPGT